MPALSAEQAGYSSVGRASDCRVTADIRWSLARFRVARLFVWLSVSGTSYCFLFLSAFLRSKLTLSWPPGACFAYVIIMTEGVFLGAEFVCQKYDEHLRSCTFTHAQLWFPMF